MKKIIYLIRKVLLITVSKIKKVAVLIFNSFLFLFNRKNFKVTASYIFLSLGMSLFGICFFTYLPNNISGSLNNVLINETNNNPSSMSGIVYPEKMVPQDVMAYRMPEWSNKIRNAYPSLEVFDVYQAKWNQMYSPGVVDYLDSVNNHISFLMLPTETYMRYDWIYDMELVCPSSKPLTNPAASTDIYINLQYADFLLEKYNLENGNYEKLLNPEYCYINIPYSWSFAGNSQNPKLVQQPYVIKGVINSNADTYLKYSKIFGDFFIVREFFSIPLPSITYFELADNSRTNIQLFDVINSTYKFDSVFVSTTKYSSAPSYEYRITFVDNIDTDNSILKVNINDSSINLATKKIYNDFYNNNYIYVAIFFGSLFLGIMILYVVFCLRIKKTVASYRYIKITKFLICFLNLFMLAISLALSHFVTFIPLFKHLLLYNENVFMFYLITIFVSCMLLFLCNTKKYKNNYLS